MDTYPTVLPSVSIAAAELMGRGAYSLNAFPVRLAVSMGAAPAPKPETA
jgi:hypothetical protein